MGRPWTKDGQTVLTVGAQGGAAVSLQRGHIVKQTRGLIYYKPEALPGRSGSSLFNDEGTKVIGLVQWRTGDGHGLAMNAAAVRSFVGGEVADVETELPEDANPLWQSRVRLVLVTSNGCQPCELQKQSMSGDVRYETIDIQKVNAKGYNVRVTPTLMVFVDGNLEHTSSGLLRGDRLRAFLDRWGFTDNQPQPDDADLSDDDLTRGTIPAARSEAQSATASKTRNPALPAGSSPNGSAWPEAERRFCFRCCSLSIERYASCVSRKQADVQPANAENENVDRNRYEKPRVEATYRQQNSRDSNLKAKPEMPNSHISCLVSWGKCLSGSRTARLQT